MSRPVNENSTDMCAACDTDLATCETIWAAEGILYCSRECGIHDFKYAYGDVDVTPVKLCDEFDSFRKADGSFDWEGSAVII